MPKDSTFNQERLSKYLVENNLNRNTLVEFTLPDGISEIQRETFCDCSSLTTIDLPDSLTKIGFKAFMNCTSLNAIELPHSLAEIDRGAFAGCSSLTSIELPNGLTEIRNGVFQNCTSLTFVGLPDSLSKIGCKAFSNLSALKQIKLPNGLSKIDKWAFDFCTSLTHIVLPNGLTEIEHQTFACCKSLKSIELPDGLTEISELAFYGCTSLTSIELPTTLTKIGYDAFSGCTSLSHIELPNVLIVIEQGAFVCTSLKHIATNQSIDWEHIGVDTNQTNIFTYRQYLEHTHPSLIEKLDMRNLEPQEAYLIYKMIHNHGYLPTRDTLKDTFTNRSIVQIRDLLMGLSKNIKAINDVIPSVEITLNDTPLHESFNAYLSIRDCDNIFDANHQVNFIWQRRIKKHQDSLSKVVNEQNSIEFDKPTAERPDNRRR